MKKTLSLLFTLLIAVLYLLFEKDIPQQEIASQNHNEKYYQTKMCDALSGDMEVVLEDKARIDCLTTEYAIEVDFAKKWAEGIGQALYYAQMSGKKPAVALISGANDTKFINRLETVAKKYNIKVILIEEE